MLLILDNQINQQPLINCNNIPKKYKEKRYCYKINMMILKIKYRLAIMI